MLKLYQKVLLNVDSLTDDFIGEPVKLHRGQLGMIMDVCKHPGIANGYTVEFFDNDGTTLGLVTLAESYLLPISGSHPPQEVA